MRNSTVLSFLRMLTGHEDSWNGGIVNELSRGEEVQMQSTQGAVQKSLHRFVTCALDAEWILSPVCVEILMPGL